jgi:hypothetical protein
LLLEGWKVIKIDGHFRIRIPTSAATRVEEDGGTVAIRLGQGEDATEILIANYPFKRNSPVQQEFLDILKDTLAVYFDGVREVGGRELALDVEVVSDAENGAWCAKGSAHVDEAWDLAKVCARLGEDTFWLLHWSGPLSQLKSPVSQIFESFRFNEGDAASEGSIASGS